MNGSGIDTSAMLTMLGLIAAVWAVVPETSRLSFRLSLAWWDWLIIWCAVAAIHVLYFEPVLRALKTYPVLGPWSWGFDKGGTQYLFFLVLAGYVYFRSRTTRLNRSKLPVFERLVTSLLRTRKFEELAVLLDQHLEVSFEFAEASGFRGSLAKRLRPKRPLPGVKVGADGTVSVVEPPRASVAVRGLNHIRESLASAFVPAEAPQQRARAVVKAVLSSRDMVAYLALARPYLCLQVMEKATSILEEFQDEFFDALLGNESSILYSELKNSRNFAGSGGHRLDLPMENMLLVFYLKDVKTAGRLGVSRSVGEAVLTRVDADDALQKKLNGPLLTYDGAGKFRCPVYTGIAFFRIMVLEGLRQRSNDHLWLQYFPHFARRLVARARDIQADDQNHEFPTPLCYLLYELIDTTTAWIKDASCLTKPSDSIAAEITDGSHVYISFKAAEALPGVLEPILRSDHLTRRLKEELLSVVLNTLENLERDPQLVPS